jgi:ribonucleotide monophosphatase NagD (HAD superfamily)
MRDAGYAIRFLTNDGINSRDTRLQQLRARGLELERDELYTASYLAARFIEERGFLPFLPLFGRPALDEFAGLPRATAEARAVVVGDYFPHYDYEVLQAAYEALERGAQLVAMHRKRHWPTGGRRVVDLGFWVAGLEFCGRCPATVIGKPSEYSYSTVIRDAGFTPERVVMISDEEDPDLHGARRWGIRTVHFDPAVSEGSEEGEAGAILADSYERVWEALRSGESRP